MSLETLPYRNLFFRFLNFTVVSLPSRSKFYVNLILMKHDLKDLPLIASDHRVHVASETDVHAIQNHPEKASIAYIYEGRLGAGHSCYVAKKGNELLGFLWVNPTSFSHYYGSDHPFLFRVLGKKERFTYDWHVFQEYRNRGVLKTLVWHMLKDLKTQNVEVVYSTTEIKNRASILAHLGCGFSSAGLLYLYRLGNFKRAFGGTQGEARALKRWLVNVQKESAGK